MKERPILFSAPMVRAILEGRKSQTRRVVKPQGDRLWVRETWGIGGARLIDPCLNYRADGAQVPLNDGIDVGWCIGSRPLVGVDDAALCAVKDGWRPSIHMPRWASRITLEITDVRVQRLQEISEEDAIAEGVEKLGEFPNITPWRNYEVQQPAGARNFSTARRSFISLWDSINRKRHPSSVNPWVWAISFRRLP